MKEWILICHGEFEIHRPTFYNTKDEAVKAMCSEVADILNMTLEEVMEVRLAGTLINDYAIVGDDYAFVDCNSSYDWRIFDVDWENASHLKHAAL